MKRPEAAGIDMSLWLTKEHENRRFFVMPEVSVGHPEERKSGFRIKCGMTNGKDSGQAGMTDIAM